MEPEDKEILRRVLELSQKNNKMLNSIQRSMFWGKVYRYIYWIIIVGVAIGAYYYLEPYINGVLQVYGSVKDNVTNIFQ
jgi:hypothetical protein